LVRLPREDLTVSRRHCLLEIDAPAAMLRDLGSTNGTYVNGQRVGRPGRWAGADAPAPEQAASRPLWCGDELQVGDTAFRVLVVTAEEADRADYSARSFHASEGAARPECVGCC
jgi:pSer/pThr/pTyr-binding forkhead associated (FHA) protein